MTLEEKRMLLRITKGLMLSDNFGDVHDEINHLCRILKLPKPTGDFVNGWTDEDFEALGEE